MPFYACKLPHGLTFKLDDNVPDLKREVTLVGANIGENLEQVSPNGSPNDNRQRIYGYGITELSDEDSAGVAAWLERAKPFGPVVSGALQGPFKTRAEAEKEIKDLHAIVSSGFEGLDPDKEGVEKADEGDGKKK